jgi:hypothetical protein
LTQAVVSPAGDLLADFNVDRDDDAPRPSLADQRAAG